MQNNAFFYSYEVQTYQYYQLHGQVLDKFYTWSKRSVPIELLFSTVEQAWFASFMTIAMVPHHTCHE